MAQSVFRHRPGRTRGIPRWDVDAVSRSTAGAWRSVLATYRRDPRRFLWNLFWLPFWLGSEAPPPALPGARRVQAAATPGDSAGTYLTTRIDRITRRFAFAWLAGALLRGLTLALLIMAIWGGLALFGVAGLPGPMAVASLVGLGMLGGGAFAWLARPDRLMVARMFDRTFALQERIVTAFDRPQDGSHVSRLQLADAANTLDEIAAEIPRSTFLPVREAAICLIVSGALVTLLLAYVPRDAIAAVADSPVPQFVPASERLAARDEAAPPPPLAEQPEAERASIAEIQERGRQSQSAREDLARIGDALRNHPITQPAAESIASGDYAAAADTLRAASEAAATMDQASRDALADDLEAAAQEVSAENPELAQAASEAASALREGGPEAESALGGLADQVEETGEQVSSQEELARDLDEAQSGSSDSGSAAGEGSEGEQSAGQSQSSSESGAGQGQQASDPGEGASAQPGVSNQPQESAGSSSSSGSSEGSSQEGGGESSESAGEAAGEGQPGEGESSSPGEGAAGDGSGGDQQGLQGAPNDETSASQGSGAGTGQRGANDQNTSDDAVDASAGAGENPEAEAPGAGEAGDPPPSRASRGEEDDATGTASQGATNLQLEGASDSGVQTGGDSGSSSLGSGSGSTTASGEGTAGNVGVAGPDSNRVPDALRDVVQDYFEGPEE